MKKFLSCLVFVVALMLVFTVFYKEELNPISGKNLTRGMVCRPAPEAWVEMIKEFAKDYDYEGKILLAAQKTNPQICIGNTALHLGRDIAITVGNRILIQNGEILSKELYMHELGHVYQYHVIGEAAFLRLYFGELTLRCMGELALPMSFFVSISEQLRAVSFESMADELDYAFTVWSIKEGQQVVKQIEKRFEEEDNLL